MSSGPPHIPQSVRTRSLDADGDTEESNSYLQMSAQLENPNRLTWDTRMPRSEPEVIRIVPGRPIDSSVNTNKLKSHFSREIYGGCRRPDGRTALSGTYIMHILANITVYALLQSMLKQPNSDSTKIKKYYLAWQGLCHPKKL